MNFIQRIYNSVFRTNDDDDDDSNNENENYTDDEIDTDNEIHTIDEIHTDDEDEFVHGNLDQTIINVCK
jgi:hypothetical protein